MDLLVRYYNLKGSRLFILIAILNLLLLFISRTGLINEIVFYNTFSEQFTYDRSLKLFDDMNRFSWIGYVLSPLILLIKFSLVSIVIYIGIVFIDIRDKISLGSVFRVVMAGEIVFICAGAAKFLWFYLFAGNYDLNDLGFFYPLSLINFFQTGDVNKLWVFPLQTINLFQIIYITSIAFGLNKVCQIRKSDSEKIVLVSYLPAMVLWIALIMFISIDFSL
jgi:hypothetical protein